MKTAQPKRTFTLPKKQNTCLPVVKSNNLIFETFSYLPESNGNCLLREISQKCFEKSKYLPVWQEQLLRPKKGNEEQIRSIPDGFTVPVFLSNARGRQYLEDERVCKEVFFIKKFGIWNDLDEKTKEAIKRNYFDRLVFVFLLGLKLGQEEAELIEKLTY